VEQICCNGHDCIYANASLSSRTAIKWDNS
jgi:hypothetical protein